MADEMKDKTLPEGDAGQGDLSTGIDREAIARRAHNRYERRGGVHGRAEEDWLEAERELIAARLEEE